MGIVYPWQLFGESLVTFPLEAIFCILQIDQGKGVRSRNLRFFQFARLDEIVIRRCDMGP